MYVFTKETDTHLMRFFSHIDSHQLFIYSLLSMSIAFSLLDARFKINHRKEIKTKQSRGGVTSPTIKIIHHSILHLNTIINNNSDYCTKFLIMKIFCNILSKCDTQYYPCIFTLYYRNSQFTMSILKINLGYKIYI